MPHTFGGWQSEVKVAVSSEHPPFPYSPRGGRGKGALWSLDDDSDPICGGPTLMTSSPQSLPLPNTVTLGVRISTYEIWGNAFSL